MKKVLFVSNPMNCGGIEKALLSLLQEIDYTRYEVYFMPYTNEDAVWNEKVPKPITIIEPPEYLETMMMFRKNMKKTIFWGMKHPVGLFFYLLAILDGIVKRNMDISRQRFWMMYQKFLPCIEGEYDVAIDFRSEIGCYFMVDKIQAKQKIGWYHGVYSNYGRNKKIDGYYWKQLDHMVAISLEGKEDLIRNFPFLENKVAYIPNFLPVEQIRCLAEENIKLPYEEDAINIVSVGRLDKGKNYSLAIDVADVLRKYGCKLRWVIVGDGDEFVALKNKIEELGLEKEVFLAGTQNNPYPYMKGAQFFVHTSLMEGKPIVIDEAKLLGKIVVTTPFPTAKNQIQDGTDGKIVTFVAEDIAKEIMKIYEDKDLQFHYIKNLSAEQNDCNNDISHLYKIIDGC